MGTLASNPAALAAFDPAVHKSGLDLRRSSIGKALGLYKAGPTATFRAGSIVMRDASGYVVQSDGSAAYGVAKWGRVPFGRSVVVDQAVVLTGTAASQLKVNNKARGNLSNLTVRSAPNMGGTLHTQTGATTQLIVDLIAGTIARNPAAASPITDGATVYATFTYDLVDADYAIDGRFFQNQAADRTLYENDQVTVITDWSILFTTEWASSNGVTGLTYAVNTVLYAGTTGQFTPVAGTIVVGRVFQNPTSSDPFMGVAIHGNPS